MDNERRTTEVMSTGEVVKKVSNKGAASSAPGRVQDTTYIPVCGYFCRTVLCGPFFVLLLAAER